MEKQAEVPQPKAEPVALDRVPAFLRSEPAVLVAMLVALGIYYLVPNIAAKAIGGLAFFALTLYRPDLQLAMVPLAAPLFYRQQPLIGDRFFFPLAEVVVLVGVAAWVVRDGWTLLRTRRLPWLREWARNPAVWLALLLALIGVVALFVVPGGESARVALREFRWTVAEPVLFFALMLRWLRTERDLWRMVGAWLVAAALVAREGAEQFFYGETWRMEGVGRVTSVYPSATALGLYLGRPLALGIVLAFFLPMRWLTWKVGVGILSAVIGLGVLFSFARGAWIGVFIALAVVALITRHRWLMLGIGATILAGLAAFPFVNVARITSLFDFTTPDNTGIARGKIWAAALRIIGDHPITGIGQDQFLRQDPKYEVPQTRFFLTSHPHNWILDFWLRLGLPGLLWMVGALVFFFWQSWGLWRAYRNTALGALVLGLMASMIDFAVHGLFDMAYFTMDLALTFWLTLGLVVVLKRGVRTTDDGA